MDLDAFRQNPLMGILRGITDDAADPLLDAAVSGGLGAIEITMNTDGAESLIRRMSKRAAGRIPVGAGTVLSVEAMQRALDAGATFIVSPALVPDVVSCCAENNIPVFPGAFTPQEILNAWDAGATMVKVFPAKFFGPSYIKEVKGPLDHIELLACGGVSPDNIKAFFDAGAAAAAFGGSVFRPEWIETGNFDAIAGAIRVLRGNVG